MNTFNLHPSQMTLFSRLRPGQKLIVCGKTYTINHIEGLNIYLEEVDKCLRVDGLQVTWEDPSDEFEIAPDEMYSFLMGLGGCYD